MIKILIVEDHKIVREGLSRIISTNKNLKIVGEIDSGESVIKYTSKLNPDVILMDIKLPKISGIETTEKILKSSKHKKKPKIIILSMYDDEVHIIESLKAGASGYITKDCTSEEIVEAINRVIKGEIYIQKKSVPRFVNAFSKLKTIKEDSLTFKEIELIKLVAKGLANKEIAKITCSAEKTVKNQLNVIFNKLGVVNRAQLVKEAIKRNIIAPDI